MKADAIEPVWLRDLAGIWAADDLRQATARMGFAPVSPMFAFMGVAEDTDSDGSYSPLEVQAMRQALDELHDALPDLWAAFVKAFKPWTRDVEPGTPEQVQAACTLLADRVDELVG